MKPVVYNREADVKKQVKKLLDENKWFWWMPPANGFGRIGVSDVNALKNGVFIAVETKFGKNKPTAHQKAYLDSIIAEKGYGFVVNERNIQFFEQFLGAFDRSVIGAMKGERPTDEDGSLMINAIRALTEDLLA